MASCGRLAIGLSGAWKMAQAGRLPIGPQDAILPHTRCRMDPVPLTRRNSLKALTGAALASTACSRSERRPNILYIMTDDHVPGAMSCYGNKILQTPNLDRLASEGTRFNNCFVTNSLCAPGRATVLTG